ncbi:MAG: hypothetical protein K2P73_20575 [Lachnospiraceae bacterium]|nr:hypothetical protein [Lachnospiraceae bacterium]
MHKRQPPLWFIAPYAAVFLLDNMLTRRFVSNEENEHGYSRNSKKPSGKHPKDGKDINKKEWKPSDSLRERIAEYAMGGCGALPAATVIVAVTSILSLALRGF